MNSTIKIFIFRQYVRYSIFTGFVLMAQYDSNFFKQTSRRVFSSVLCIPRPTLCCVAMKRDYVPWGHWRQPRRGCRGHIPPNFGWGTSTGISPPILLRTFGYSRPILIALRSLSLKPISFGYIRRHQFASVRQADSRLTRLDPTNLQLALTSPLPGVQAVRRAVGTHMRHRCWDVLWRSHSCIVTDA